MAWSSAELSATELALRADDMPILAASVGMAPDAVEWSAAGSFAGADITDASYPGRRAYDGKPHLATKPNTSGTQFYYLLDFSTTPIEFDAFALMGYGTSLDGITVTLEIDDLSTFAGATSIGAITPGATGARKIDIDMFHTGSTALRYSDVPYVRLNVSGTTFTPEIGELLLLRTYQLKHKPRLPWDEDSQIGESLGGRTWAGVDNRIVTYRGMRALSASINPHETSYQTEILDWFSDSDQGARPFVWIDDPATTPAGFNLMTLDEPALSFPLIGFTERALTISASEQGPERFFLSRES